MTNQTSDKGITFEVHAVDPATEPRLECLTGDALRTMVARSDNAPAQTLLSWSGYNSKSLADVTFHPLIFAVHLAFSEHRPLVLSPDMIWIVIVQGLAQHIRNNPEKFRSRLVSHAGIMSISANFEDDVFLQSPETAWDGVIHALSASLRNNVSAELYDALMCDFTTTGYIERTVCEIALLDAFEPYFDYNVYCSCGFPAITLQGGTADWVRLREKVEVLADFEVDWWLTEIRTVLDHFVRASRGDIDLDHWGDMYKRELAYGRDRINGWIVKLIPYVKGDKGIFDRKNPLLVPIEYPGSNDTVYLIDWVTNEALPSGVAVVPFTLHTSEVPGKSRISMQFLGGFVGIEQDEETLALTPKLGWAVRRTPLTQWIPGEIPECCDILEPLDFEDYHRLAKSLGPQMRFQDVTLPNDFANFYRQCGGITIADDATGTTARLRPLQDMPNYVGPDENGDMCRWMVTIADLADGSTVELRVDPFDREKFPVWKVTANGDKQPLARSFTAFVGAFVEKLGQL